MDKVYYQYRDALKTANQLMDDLGGEMEGDSLGMGVIRKEVDLTNEEKQYLLAVERGDIPSARQFLKNGHARLNINCVDPLGRTALLIAIENENIEMIELLLSHNIEIGDALLHAIEEENVEAVELILNHELANKGEQMYYKLQRTVFVYAILFYILIVTKLSQRLQSRFKHDSIEHNNNVLYKNQKNLGLTGQLF
ncbi:hypothetical protein ACJMK2_032583 [Sinanodonta woodiana]|uniref:Ankyrin repeat domain-containing protein n=1 Tax=Sinanodonta woodiana TaxID=1069815 RepID=A0ABD3X3N3_SINWO